MLVTDVVGVAVGVQVAVGVGVRVGVAVGVQVGIQVGVGVGVQVGIQVGVAVGMGSGVCVAVGVGAGSDQLKKTRAVPARSKYSTSIVRSPACTKRSTTKSAAGPSRQASMMVTPSILTRAPSSTRKAKRYTSLRRKKSWRVQRTLKLSAGTMPGAGLPKPQSKAICRSLRTSAGWPLRVGLLK